MHIRSWALWVILFYFLVLIPGSGAAPNLINYQGRLTDEYGVPITVAVTVTFTFWDAPSLGAQLGSFSDVDSVTPTLDGLYATLIGDDPADDAGEIPASIFAGGQVYLNVQVGGEDLSPRLRMTSSAYAILAGQAIAATGADNLDGLDSTDFALTSHTHDGADVTSGTIAPARLPHVTKTIFLSGNDLHGNKKSAAVYAFLEGGTVNHHYAESRMTAASDIVSFRLVVPADYVAGTDIRVRPVIISNLVAPGTASLDLHYKVVPPGQDVTSAAFDKAAVNVNYVMPGVNGHYGEALFVIPAASVSANEFIMGSLRAISLPGNLYYWAMRIEYEAAP